MIKSTEIQETSSVTMHILKLPSGEYRYVEVWKKSNVLRHVFYSFDAPNMATKAFSLGKRWSSVYFGGMFIDYEHWVNGELHCLTGPATKRVFYDKQYATEIHYYIDTDRLSKEDWEIHPKRLEYLIAKELEK